VQNPHAAGIDVHSDNHVVCVGPGRVETFGAYTADLHAIADHLRRAGVDLLLPLVVGRVLRLVRPQPAAGPPARPLTDPIWDLPSEGGGMSINGRWYTEHALERMAPDTPAIRAELRTRAAARLERLGIKQGSPAWDKCMERALQKIDPRGVSPSVVEAEVSRPGSTNVRVITAKRGQVVITVVPRKANAP
jgi:hypothetical protein